MCRAFSYWYVKGLYLTLTFLSFLLFIILVNVIGCSNNLLGYLSKYGFKYNSYTGKTLLAVNNIRLLVS